VRLEVVTYLGTGIASIGKVVGEDGTDGTDDRDDRDDRDGRDGRDDKDDRDDRDGRLASCHAVFVRALRVSHVRCLFGFLERRSGSVSACKFQVY